MDGDKGIEGGEVTVDETNGSYNDDGYLDPNKKVIMFV